VQYPELTLNDIRPSFVRSWLASLREEKLEPKSINRKISGLKSFFKFHLKHGAIEVSPMATISSLKVNKRLPSFIRETEIDTLLRHVEFPDNWEGKTEHLLIKLFYETGIRLSELVNLKVSQLDKSNINIKVLGKGSKERIIPISRTVMDELQTYQGAKPAAFKEFNPEFFFINGKGKKLYPKYVYNTVNKYLGLVTTSEKKSPHILRHSFATHLMNNGAELNAVKELLGHSSLAATQIYTHNTIEKLKDIHKKAHPKGE
jgi:integrase/recombinase XerC